MAAADEDKLLEYAKSFQRKIDEKERQRDQKDAERVSVFLGKIMDSFILNHEALYKTILYTNIEISAQLIDYPNTLSGAYILFKKMVGDPVEAAAAEGEPEYDTFKLYYTLKAQNVQTEDGAGWAFKRGDDFGAIVNKEERFEKLCWHLHKNELI